MTGLSLAALDSAHEMGMLGLPVDSGAWVAFDVVILGSASREGLGVVMNGRAVPTWLAISMAPARSIRLWLSIHSV